MEINGIEYVNVDTASKMLEVSSGRVRQLIADGTLPTLKLTKRLNMIPLRNLEEFMNLPSKEHGRKRNVNKSIDNS
jgi:hypothetical protein